jgi:hypothetical protein
VSELHRETPSCFRETRRPSFTYLRPASEDDHNDEEQNDDDETQNAADDNASDGSSRKSIWPTFKIRNVTKIKDLI